MDCCVPACPGDVCEEGSSLSVLSRIEHNVCNEDYDSPMVHFLQDIQQSLSWGSEIRTEQRRRSCANVIRLFIESSR